MKNKKEFEIKNFLDQRYRSNKDFQRWFNKYTLAALVDGAIIALVFSCAMFYPYKTSPQVLEPTIEVKAQEDTNQKDKYKLRGYARCYDPITCIRDIGEELGMSDKDITTMVKIGKCESNYRPEAQNGSSTAKGIFQIVIGTWDGNRCEGERWDFVDNIKCGWKIYQSRGTQPWVSSKSCWSK